MAGFWNRSTEMLITLFIFELASLWTRGVLLCSDEALHGVRPSVFSASSEHRETLAGHLAFSLTFSSSPIQWVFTL